VLGFALGLVQMILYCIYRNGDKKKGNAKAAPLDPLKSVVIESSLGGTGEVFEVKKNDGEEGNKSKEEEEEEEEEKKKSIEETDEYDCKV
jgi:solute carrier family 50 (sugar transporter)